MTTLEEIRVFLRHDGADTRERRRERNIPKPSILKSSAENVAVARWRKPVSILVISKQRQVLKEVRINSFADLSVNLTRISGSINDVFRVGSMSVAAFIQKLNRRRAAVFEDDVFDCMLLAHFHAIVNGILEKHVVKL